MCKCQQSTCIHIISHALWNNIFLLVYNYFSMFCNEMFFILYCFAFQGHLISRTNKYVKKVFTNKDRNKSICQYDYYSSGPFSQDVKPLEKTYWSPSDRVLNLLYRTGNIILPIIYTLSFTKRWDPVSSSLYLHCKRFEISSWLFCNCIIFFTTFHNELANRDLNELNV